MDWILLIKIIASVACAGVFGLIVWAVVDTFRYPSEPGTGY